jgi:ABC-2 type transport system permease protein
MPSVIQAFTYLIPAKYFLVALRSLLLKGAGIGAFWEQLLSMLGFAALMLTASTLRLKKSSGEDAADKKRQKPSRGTRP